MRYRSNNGHGVVDVEIMEENILEEDLSFSSSSGMDLGIPLGDDDENGGEEAVDGGEASHDVLLTLTLDSLQQLYAHSKQTSSLSASAQTSKMSNLKRNSTRDCTSPPNCLNTDEAKTKRSIFGKQAKKKYNVRRTSTMETGKSSQSNGQVNKSPLSDLIKDTSINPRGAPTDQDLMDGEYYSSLKPANKSFITPPRTPGKENEITPPPLNSVGFHNFLSPNMSPLTPLGKSQAHNEGGYDNQLMRISDADESSMESRKEYAVQFDPTITQHYNNEDPTTPPTQKSNSPPDSHDSHHHAQALLLSLAFFFIWSPQNLLAPNLTQAAYDFGYGDDTRARDLYLGSNLALASSVLSLPLSAFIGFASDVVSSRRILISVTTFVGGMAAIATGMATTYPQLILSRFIGGSCMSGSVPVVFSLLSDWFDDKDRNAASSGFTAMMGAGILMGQVYAGYTGTSAGWRYSFYTSGILTMLLAILVMICIREPIRGGKERVLQEMLARGGKYDKKLTFSQFLSSMTNHSSNFLLMLQGFFCNIPWGVMFVFLNDFLSQEKGLTVPDATFIVAVFGVGCAVGGILGGFLGSLASRADRRYLPLFMSLTTLLGIGPFLALLDDSTYDHASLVPCSYAFAGGCLASMPSVNVRPCIINVNPPEMRGAVLTAANLIINAARGAGPSFLTAIFMGIWGVNRATGFNIMIIIFWTIASIQLALLAKTLPVDQEKMETELKEYAMSSMDVGYGSISIDNDTRDGTESYRDDITFDGDRSLFSIENQASAFDAGAARRSLQFMGDSIREINDDLDLGFCNPTCGQGNRVDQSVYKRHFPE